MTSESSHMSQVFLYGGWAKRFNVPYIILCGIW